MSPFREEPMKKLTLLPLIAIPLFSFADVIEYKGKVTDLLLGKSTTIKVGVNQSEDDPLLPCSTYSKENPWTFSFERGHDYSDAWFETLNTVRRTQETIRVGYTANEGDECPIEYIALLKGDGSSDDDPVGDFLERTGQYGNIAQIYTNGLTEANYHASGNYNADVPAAGFDGFVFNDQIVEGEGTQISRGIWLVKKDTENKDTEYWLQVEFEQDVTISGFRVMLNAKSAELGRGPRVIKILTALDGEDFEEQGMYNLSRSIDQRANLPEKVTARVFRILVEANHGDAYIEIDELEVYAN